LSKCLHLVLCAAAILIDGYDVQTMGLAIPSLAKATGLPPQNFGVVITAGVTGMAVGAIMLAPLADRFGRKLAMVVALLAIALSTLGMTSVEMPIELSGWRFVSGLGLGALLPVTAQAASIVRPERRTFALTLIAASAGAGSFLAGMSAPSLEKVAGWQGLFYLGALLPRCPSPDCLRRERWLARGRKRASRSESNFEPRSPAVLFSSALRRRTMLICGIFFVSLLATYSLINWLPTLLSLAGWARGDAQRASGLSHWAVCWEDCCLRGYPTRQSRARFDRCFRHCGYHIVNSGECT
jgi:AAHS family 4-hydroxybenzoate transporter-like MFS transporter